MSQYYGLEKRQVPLSIQHLQMPLQAVKTPNHRKEFGKKKRWLNFANPVLPPLASTLVAPEISEEDHKKVLDGFLLIDAGKVDFPDELTRVDLTSRQLHKVATEDLEYFTQLTTVDLGDNELKLEQLAAFPVLEEAHLNCNNIRNIPRIVPDMFRKLKHLDLSHNLLKPDQIGYLSNIATLSELNLSGNGLDMIPKNMVEFVNLQVLNVSCNKLQKLSIWHTMASIPKLRELNASWNEFRSIPPTSKDSFPKLEWINVSHNKISDEKDLKGLMSCTQLVYIVLHSNPLTENARICRSEVTINNRIVTLVTDPPPSESALAAQKVAGKRIQVGKQGAMRSGTYTNFRISKVLDLPTIRASDSLRRQQKQKERMGLNAQARRSFNQSGSSVSSSSNSSSRRAIAGAAHGLLHKAHNGMGQKRNNGRSSNGNGNGSRSRRSAGRRFGPRDRGGGAPGASLGEASLGSQMGQLGASEMAAQTYAMMQQDAAEPTALQATLAMSRGSRFNPQGNSAKLRGAISTLRATLARPLTTRQFQAAPQGFEQHTVAWNIKKKPKQPYVLQLKRTELNPKTRQHKSEAILSNIDRVLGDMQGMDALDSYAEGMPL